MKQRRKKNKFIIYLFILSLLFCGVKGINIKVTRAAPMTSSKINSFAINDNYSAIEVTGFNHDFVAEKADWRAGYYQPLKYISSAIYGDYYDYSNKHYEVHFALFSESYSKNYFMVKIL